MLNGISCLMENLFYVWKKTSITVINLYINPRIYHLRTKLTQEIINAEAATGGVI